MAKSVRPWQGTLLAVLSIIGAVFSFIFAILFFVGGSFLEKLLTGEMMNIEGMAEVPGGAAGMMSMMAGFTVAIGAVFIVFGIIDSFVANGFLRGQKWAVILTGILQGLGVLGIISQLFTQSQELASNLTGLVIAGLLLWADVICWKHPFYNQK